MRALIVRGGLLPLLVGGCFRAIVDPAGHPCMSDAECGNLVCDPDEKVCADPEATTGPDGTATGTSTPTTSSPTSGPTTSTTSSATTDDESSGATSSTGEPGMLGIDAVVPDKGRADIDRDVVVSGSGFVPGVAVFFGDDAVEILGVSEGQIDVRVPPNAAAIGPVDVRVELDGDDVSLPDGYTRVRAHPTFEALPVVALLDDGVVPAAADMVVGQFVGDDALDLVFGWENGANGIAAAAGDGAGGFEVVWEDANPAISVAEADLDEDGNLDFVTVDGAGVRTWLNDGSNAFVSSTSAGVVPYPRGIATLDADGLDGPDVVVRGAYDQGIQVWLNDGTGDLFAPVTYAAGEIDSADQIVHPAIGDFTGDGWDDILAPVQGPLAPVAGFALFINDGAGGFLDPVFIDVGMSGMEAIAAHVNVGVDDHLDAVVLGYASETVVLAGDGDGGFDASAIAWTLPAGPWRVEVADLNCDDASDLVTLSWLGGFSVHRGSPGGAYTLSGAETFADAGQTKELAVVDFDGDGLPDILVDHYAPDGTLEIHPYRNTSAE